MDKDTDGYITETEFIRCWINTEAGINEKIQRNTEEIRKANDMLEENRMRLIEYKKKEDRAKDNQYKISTLLISIIEGRNVAFEKSNVRVSHGETNYSTSFIPGNFPNYQNQQFRCEGLSPSDRVNLFINDGFDENNVYTGSFEVGKFGDQKIHNEWITMTGRSNQLNQTKLHIKVHYIYSKSEITETTILKWQDYIKEKETKNEELKKDLTNLYSPFGFIDSLNKKPAYFDEIRPIDKLGPDEGFEPRFSTVPPKPLHPILKVALIFAILLGIVCCCALDYKHHLLLDLCIIFFIVTMYFLDFVDFTVMSIIFTLLFLAISITVEAFWFEIYTKNWWNSVYIDDGSLVKFRKYQKWVSIVSLCLKAILFIILFVSIFLIKKKKKNYGGNYKENYSKSLKNEF